MDLAEPLVSFDADADAVKTRKYLIEKDFDLAGIRKQGLVCGFARREDLVSGCCGDHLIVFSADNIPLSSSAGIVDVVRSLAVNPHCFVSILDQPSAIITMQDLEKPPMRMFLFGVITIAEMMMREILCFRYAEGEWQQFLSPSRLEKARELKAERERRGQQVDLIDCLQFGDKGTILSHEETFQNSLEFKSRREMRQALKELETLRNNLAHAQSIIPESWHRITILCSRINRNMERLANFQKNENHAPQSVIAWQQIENLMRNRDVDWWGRLIEAIPEIASLTGTPQPAEYHSEGDVAEHTRLAVTACPENAGSHFFWVALLHDIGKPSTTVQHADGRVTAHDHARVGAEISEAILKRIGIPDNLRDIIVWIIRHHNFYHSWNLKQNNPLSKKQRKFISDERFPLLLEFMRIDAMATLGHPRKLSNYNFYQRIYDAITNT